MPASVRNGDRDRNGGHDHDRNGGRPASLGVKPAPLRAPSIPGTNPGPEFPSDGPPPGPFTESGASGA
ncbi:hypothetical protein [Streptomyces cyaneofuscatus]|uniref:hypothetical protein n=1 Tax=Streptomyces cyaneofuscatus TaxID=66883 RepID=UPI00381EBD60